eukprot:Anaeramoba_ignava/a608922_17.p1 GENE.a608922_17~~a608922_17.p1  ORF type:complete len:138 (-),score=35.32 a608922_17:103-516(-)
MDEPSVFFGTLCCSIVVVCAVIIPSLTVAAPDKDKDCDKNLWNWILVANIIFAIANIVYPFMFFFEAEIIMIFVLFQALFAIFLLVWGSIGLTWAKSSGIKDQCGKLWSVTMADSITIISLNFLGFVLGMIFFATHR